MLNLVYVWSNFSYFVDGDIMSGDIYL